MEPINKLLNRIKWDKEFGKGCFEIGYYDRLEDTIIKVRYEAILFDPGRKDVFLVIDDEGVTHSIPYHRVREVYKNNALIWRRK